MLRTTCLLIPTLLLTGCSLWTSTNSSGKATAILDAAHEPAAAHRDALVTGDIHEARRTGLELLTILSCWPNGCQR